MTTKSPTKPVLQEEALQLEVSIYYPEGHEKEGKELLKDDLVEAIANKKAEVATKHEADEKAKQAARDADKPGENPPEPKPVPMSKRQSGSVRDADPSLVAAHGLNPVTDKDRALAKKHGYPIAIPGGKPYRTSVSFNCSMGGGLREMGSVVILTAYQAEHKAEFITPVK